MDTELAESKHQGRFGKANCALGGHLATMDFICARLEVSIHQTHCTENVSQSPPYLHPKNVLEEEATRGSGILGGGVGSASYIAAFTLFYQTLETLESKLLYPEWPIRSQDRLCTASSRKSLALLTSSLLLMPVVEGFALGSQTCYLASCPSANHLCTLCPPGCGPLS